MKNAKKFLKENLTESKAIAAKIFNIKASSLINFMKRNSNQKNENQNKILQNHEINAFDDFIRSLLKHEILFTNEIVFSVIIRLKRVYRRSTSSKNDFEIDENKIIFIKSEQNCYQSYILKSIMKKQ
jgi:hypothetical protein